MSEAETAALTEPETPGDGEDVVLDGSPENDEFRNRKILSLPVEVMVSVGSAKLTVQELMALTTASVVNLNSRIDDPVVIYVRERPIARGELVELGEPGGLGVRLTEICDAGE